MCEWGSTRIIIIKDIPVDVDSCIAGIVFALNKAGITTIASCCGHGKILGSICLEDGRELRIAPNYGVGRKLDCFPINE